MKLLIKHSSAGPILRVKVIDVASATGGGKTGLSANSGGLVTTSGLMISTIASNEATPTYYTTAAGNVQTIGTLGTYAAPTSGKCRFMEVDAVHHPGLYEIQLADARVAVAGARSLIVSVFGATDAAPVDAEIQLAGIDVHDATRAGMSSLQTLQDLLEADRVIDTSTVPWALVLIKKGSGALGAPGAIELLRQRLFDVTGTQVTQPNTILGRSLT